MANTVTIQITSINQAQPGIAAAIAQVHQLTVAVHQSGTQGSQTTSIFDRFGSVVSSVASKVLVGVRTVATFASGLYAAAGAAVLLGKALLPVIANIGTAVARLTPLLSFLPAIAAGMGLVIATLKIAGPGLATAFEPITRMFFNAKGEAAAFTKELRRVVAIDVGPAAAAFAKLNMPAIQEAMERIAYQTNLVVAGFLNWANSSQGIETVKSISTAAADAFTKLAPHVLKTATALAALAGRAADPAFKGLSNVIAGLLDKIRAWANDTSVEDINDALKDLSGYGARLKEVFGVIRDIGEWMGENEGKVKAFSDAIAAAAITIGIATGNIPAILAGTATIIVNHLDFIKEQFGGFASDMLHIFDGSTMPTEVIESLREVWEQVGPAVEETLDRITRAVRENKDAFITLGRFLADYVIPILGYVLIDTIIFVGKAIANTIAVIGGLVAAAEFMVTAVKTAFINMALVAVNSLNLLVQGAAKAFSWVPGLGPKLEAAAAEVREFVAEVNNYLKNIRDEDVYVRTHFVGGQGQSRGGEYRSGGVVSTAATGGPRSGMVMVGEEGPELVKLPNGSTVYPKANTNQMMSGGTAGGPVQIIFGSDGSRMGELLVDLVRTFMKNNGGRPELLGLKV